MRKKIVIKITSGMGNQLFQFACGYSIAKRLKYDLILDLSYYDMKSIPDKRSYTLNYFELEYPRISYRIFKESNKLFVFLNKIWIAIHTRILLKKVKEINGESIESFFEKIDKLTMSAHLEGYWQNPLYFSEFIDDIKKQFSIKSAYLSNSAKNIAQNLKESNSVSLHIRLGDYTKDRRLHKKYYINAVYMILEKTNNSIDQIVVFCEHNELNTAKQMLEELHQNNNLKVVFIEELYQFSDLEQFYLMSSCKHKIISNSTFSWWAAYLGETIDSIVVAPKINLNNDFYLDNWFTLLATF